jgi:hypothetical protein
MTDGTFEAVSVTTTLNDIYHARSDLIDAEGTSNKQDGQNTHLISVVIQDVHLISLQSSQKYKSSIGYSFEQLQNASKNMKIYLKQI